MGLPIVPLSRALLNRAILPGLGLGAAQLGLGALTGAFGNQSSQPSTEEKIADKYIEALKAQNAATLAANERAEERRAAAQAASLGLSERGLQTQAELLQRALDPKLYAERANIDLGVYKQQAQIAREAAMEQTRELTQRAIERDTINAWSNITQKQIDRDTQLAVGMMNLSATLGMPNPNVLAGMAASSRTGAAGFSPVKALY